MTDMYRLYALLASLVIGTGAVFGATLLTDDVKRLEAQQADIKTTTGKYQHIPKTKDGNIVRWVNEQQYPDGTTGYVVYEERTNADASKDLRVTSHSRDYQSQGWTRIYTPSATST